jgi:hypothetical protein
MGLDSYLYAEKRVGNYNHYSAQNKELYNKVAEAVGLTDFNQTCHGGNSVTARLPLAYWRKANQIHQFFVNLSGEDDHCQDIEVSREDLENLLSLCKQVLETRDKTLEDLKEGEVVVGPEDILPTRPGFFFGSTDYDEYYYSDLEHTVQVLEKILNHPGIPKEDYSWSFVYQASW